MAINQRQPAEEVAKAYMLDLDHVLVCIDETFSKFVACFKESKLFNAEGHCLNTGKPASGRCFRARCPSDKYFTFMPVEGLLTLNGVWKHGADRKQSPLVSTQQAFLEDEFLAKLGMVPLIERLLSKAWNEIRHLHGIFEENGSITG